MLLEILYILGIGAIIGGLMIALIYSLANLIWGALTWENDE